LIPNNGRSEKKGQKDDLYDEDDLIEEGSLCSESSWDPEEYDPLELEVDRDDLEEQ
jgi:hypothetical protein